MRPTPADRISADFVARGMVLLGPDDLGVSNEVHQQVFDQELAVFRQKLPVTPARVPAILDILGAPGVVAAIDQLAGPNWAVVPFAHNAPFLSGVFDQHWHKDDNAPYNSRRQRHHHAIQIEMLYYPQAVTEEMGPTATIPYSQYWTFNHEENHDNFAGADHLDFNYQLEGLEQVPVAGPNSDYSEQEIREATTAHDVRMRDAVRNTGWPLVEPYAAAPLQAGSVLLYSHNLFHRGNHRRDPWQSWRDNPRFMWRFWIYRTTEPGADSEAQAPDWSAYPNTGPDITAIWRHHFYWLHGSQDESHHLDETASELYEQLCQPGEHLEPSRVGAAYRLAASSNENEAIDLLTRGLNNPQESSRRASTYGLIALGEAATPTFLAACASPQKWLRKAGAHGLGDAAPLTQEALHALSQCLLADPSIYVRAVAAGSLGCLARRAIGNDVGVELVPAVVDKLLQSLAQEPNRLSMDTTQARSIKFVRPTDECDVCEGIGIDFGLDRFQPVRSAVRENALWSLVIICSHRETLSTDGQLELTQRLIDIVNKDENVINVGYAMDALTRLSAGRLSDEHLKMLKDQPLRCWEALIPAGLSADNLKELENDAPLEQGPFERLLRT